MTNVTIKQRLAEYIKLYGEVPLSITDPTWLGPIAHDALEEIQRLEANLRECQTQRLMESRTDTQAEQLQSSLDRIVEELTYIGDQIKVIGKTPGAAS